MKGFAAWAKTNWLILVLTAVAIAALPTMLFFSSRMSKGLRDGIQKQADLEFKELTTFTTSYTLPSVRDPQQKAFTATAELNKVYIDQFAQRRNAIQQQAGKVGKEAIEFNRDDHKPLIEGVFPQYAEGNRQYLSIKFAEAYTLASHEALLKRINAGPPPDAKQLAAQITEYYDQQKTRILSQVGSATMGKEDEAKLQKELLDQRIGRYRQRASELAVYAEPAIFTDVPLTASDNIPTLARYWDWQLRYWICEDLLKAVAQANSSSTSGVPGGVVKRIIKISIDNALYNQDTPDSAAATEGEGFLPPKTVDPAPLNPAVSVTGRASGPETGNQYYDLRVATVEIVASSARFPEIFDALARTNFMTVLKVDLDKVEPLEDVKDGYYYGDEHVVKATLQIETLWLRGWTKPLMPKAVKAALGVVEDPTPPPG